MTCPRCGAELVPGISECLSCGASPDDGGFRIEVHGLHMPANVTPEMRAQWQADIEESRRVTRVLTEAQALEVAGDLDAAIDKYEAMLVAGLPYTVPYKRLAIIYRKQKRHADHERVVRHALANLSEGANGWFVIRLAKIRAAGMTRT